MFRSLAFSILAVGVAAAQTSGLQGVVTDPSGATVPAVDIRIVNVATGVSNSAATNDRGCTRCQGGIQPNDTSSGTLANANIDKWFDELAFVQGAPGVFGTAGRNVLAGPGSRNMDLIVSKVFRMPRERHSLQFRFESFNVSNTPTFGQPASGLRGPATGTITQADEPRRIQFAMNYTF